MRTKVFSIKVKFTIVAVIIALVSVGVAAFLSNQWMSKAFEKQYDEKAILILKNVTHELELIMVVREPKAHEEVFGILDSYREDKRLVELRIFSLKGQEAFARQEGPSEPGVKETLRTGKSIHFHKQKNKREVSSYIAPIRNKPECYGCHGKSESLRGAILLSLSMEEMERDVSQQRLRFYILFALIAIAVSTVTIMVVNRLLLQPLSRIRKGTEAIGRGDLKYQIPVPSKDEIGELAQTFNQMSRQLKESFESIQKSQEKMFQAERLSSLGQLAAGLAHELKNPLTSIKMIFQAILDSSSHPEMTRKEAELILREVNKLDTILTQFLTFAKPPRLQLQPLELSRTVGDVLSLMKTALDQNRVEVLIEIPADLPQIRGDHERIKQVLINLLLNSIQAMPQGGKVRISAQEVFENHQKEVLLRVEDSGKGIPEKDRERVFDPFFTTKEGGTGLGLSIVYSIIKEHHGRIDLQSQVGKGTVFAITFPQVEIGEGRR